MLLIDEIIDLLSGEAGQLTNALLKTKVLLYNIGRKDLTVWVNYELNGYPDDVELPDYRVLGSTLLANASNGGRRFQEHPIPTGHLEPNIRERYVKAKLRQSLAILEQFGTKGALSRAVPPEAYHMLEKGLSNGYRIERAWCQTPSHDVKGVLTQVRSRLLDFVLELKSSLGDIDDEQGMVAKVEALDTTRLWQHSIGHVGDHATIILGGQNAIAIRNEVQKGDFESLSRALTKAGLPSDEMISLREALTHDEAEGNVDLSIGKTGHWFLNLMGRAAKGGLKIGSDVAAHVATEALTKYLGGG